MESLYEGATIVGSLVVMVLVIALTYYGSRWYAGKMSKTSAGKFIKILDRVAFGPGCTISVVQAGERFYLMGISDKNIQMLCELNDFDPGELSAPQEQMPFGQIIKSFLNKAENPPKDNGTEQ